MVIRHFQQFRPQEQGAHSVPLPACMLAQTHLVKGPYRVYFGLDFALTVQVNQLGYNASDKLISFIDISKMVATYSLVLV